VLSSLVLGDEIMLSGGIKNKYNRVAVSWIQAFRFHAQLSAMRCPQDDDGERISLEAREIVAHTLLPMAGGGGSAALSPQLSSFLVSLLTRDHLRLHGAVDSGHSSLIMKHVLVWLRCRVLALRVLLHQVAELSSDAEAATEEKALLGDALQLSSATMRELRVAGVSPRQCLLPPSPRQCLLPPSSSPSPSGGAATTMQSIHQMETLRHEIQNQLSTLAAYHCWIRAVSLNKKQPPRSVVWQEALLAAAAMSSSASLSSQSTLSRDVALSHLAKTLGRAEGGDQQQHELGWELLKSLRTSVGVH
jgi:hypothetical protein